MTPSPRVVGSSLHPSQRALPISESSAKTTLRPESCYRKPHRSPESLLSLDELLAYREAAASTRDLPLDDYLCRCTLVEAPAAPSFPTRSPALAWDTP